jgi:hypothetical protein
MLGKQQPVAHETDTTVLLAYRERQQPVARDREIDLFRVAGGRTTGCCL